MSISKEEIETRIARSKEKFQKIHSKKQEYLEKMKKGRAFFHANRDKITSYAVDLRGGYSLAFAALPKEIQGNKDYLHVIIVYTVKAPQDKFSNKIAKGYCGYRLIDPPENCKDPIYRVVHKDVVSNSKAFMTLISNLVLGKFYTRGPGISKKLWEAVDSTIKERPQLMKLS